MKRNLLLALTFTLTVLVILIPLTAGTLRPRTEDPIDGLRHFQSMEVITGKRIGWYEDWENSSAWAESSSTGSVSDVAVDGSLILSVNFSPINSTHFVQVYRNLSLSLDDDPSLDVTLSVSTGVDYGISFLGQYPNGTQFNTLTDRSYLQYRNGLGTIERISASLTREAFLARGALPPPGSTITRIVFYIASAPSTRGDFSMNILKITSFSPQEFVTNDSVTATTNLGLILNLDALPSNETLFQLIAGFDITGSSNLIYTLYFVNGYSVVAQGGVYRAKVLLPYEIANMYLGTVSSAPPFYAKNRSWAVTIVALQGEITYFRLDTLAFQYTLEGPPNVTKLAPNLIRTSLDIYLLLLLVIPIDTVIVLQWFSKHEA